MTPRELIAFENEVAERYNRGEITGPIHLSGGNENQLIDIFKEIPKDAWIFSAWRSHFYALLHGISPEKVMDQIMAGRSMNLNFPEYRFFTSAIVGVILPIAVWVASTGAKVWCFVGDMTAKCGVFHESDAFARGHDMDLQIVVEDNGMSTNTPTHYAWGSPMLRLEPRKYHYKREWPHVGSGTFVRF